MSELTRHDEAIREAKNALQLDPVSLLMNVELGYTLYWARRYDESIEQFQKTLEVDRNYPRTYFGLGRAYLEKGMGPEALLALEKGNSLFVAGNPTGILNGILGYAYGALGDRNKAFKIVDQLKIVRDQGDPDATFYLARVYTGWAIKIKP